MAAGPRMSSCTVPGCRSKKETLDARGKPVSFHSFPNASARPKLRRRPEDYNTERQDKSASRIVKLGALKVSVLKRRAVPSVFVGGGVDRAKVLRQLDQVCGIPGSEDPLTARLGGTEVIKRSDGSSALWRDVKQMLREGRFCDLRIVCANGEAVRCHRLVMASISRVIRRVLKSTQDLPPEDEVVSIYCPDLPRPHVLHFINFVYSCLANETLEKTVLTQQVLQVLEIDFSCPVIAEKEEENMAKAEMPEAADEKEFEEVLDAFADDGWTNANSLDDTEDMAQLQECALSSIPVVELERLDPLVIEVMEGRRKRSEFLPSDDEDEEEERVRVNFRPKKTGIPVKKVKPRTDGEGHRKVVELNEKFAKCEGSFEAEVMGEPLDLANHRSGFPHGMFSKALFGLRQKDQDGLKVLEGVPLLWTKTSMEDPGTQYLKAAAAMKSVFGASEMDMFDQKRLLALQGFERHAILTQIDSQNENDQPLDERTLEELEEEMKKEDHARLFKRMPTKPDFPFSEEKVRIVLDESLSVDEMEGMALLTFHSSSGPELRASASFIRVRELSKEVDMKMLASVAFDVISSRLLPGESRGFHWRLPSSKELMPKFTELARTIKLRECIKCLKKGERPKSSVEGGGVYFSRAKCVCEECGKVLMGQRRLRFHMEIMHKPATCKLCGEEFPGSFFLRKHELAKHRERFSEFICDKCGIATVSAAALEKHVIRMHTDKFRCEDCGAGFGFAGELKEHQNRKTKCSGGSVVTKSRSRRLGRKNVKTGFACPVEGCQTVVRHQNSLIVHYKHAHPEKFEREGFKCKECGRMFSEMRAMRNHVKSKHMGEEGKTHECELCHKRYVSAWALKNHQNRFHTGDRPVPCGYSCGQYFKDTMRRNYHERRTHGVVISKGEVVPNPGAGAGGGRGGGGQLQDLLAAM